MERVPQRNGTRARVVALLLLGAWTIAACWSVVAMAGAREALRDVLPRLGRAANEHQYLVRERALLRGWAVSLRLCEVLALVLVLLAVWAAVLLLQRRPHARQWATILVTVVLVALGWLLFAGFGAPLQEARPWFAPEAAFVAQLCVAVGALLLFVLSVIAVRRAPEPLEPQQDRYSIANYTRFNKPSQPAGSAALAEARARAESVLPPDQPYDEDAGDGST